MLISIPDDTSGQDLDGQTFDPRGVDNFQFSEGFIQAERNPNNIRQYDYVDTINSIQNITRMGSKQYIVFRAMKYFSTTMKFGYNIGTNSMRL